MYILCLFLFVSVYSQTKVKKRDTLFIENDINFLLQKKHPYEKYTYYYFYEDIKSEDFFYLIEKRRIYLENKNKMSLKELFIKNNFIRCIDGKKIIDDWELSEYFFGKVIFLVKKDTIIELEPNYFIE